MKLIALFAAAAFLLPQQRNEAEETFKKVVEKLSKAETIQVSFKASLEQQQDGEKSSGLVTGSILLQKDGQARLEYEGRIEGPVSTRIISDGKTTVLAVKDAPETLSPASPTLGRDVIAMLARTGGVSTVFEVQKNLMIAEIDRRTKEAGKAPPLRETDPRKNLRLSQFKVGPAEKVDGRDVGALQFVVERTGKEGKAVVTLWIDSATLLPVRRRVVDEKEGILIEETYSSFKLNEKIDPVKFELPKEDK